MYSFSVRSLIFLSMSSWLKSINRLWDDYSEFELRVNLPNILSFRSFLDIESSFFRVFIINDCTLNLCSLWMYFKDGVKDWELIWEFDCELWIEWDPWVESKSKICIDGMIKDLLDLIDPSITIYPSNTLTMPTSPTFSIMTSRPLEPMAIFVWISSFVQDCLSLKQRKNWAMSAEHSKSTLFLKDSVHIPK